MTLELDWREASARAASAHPIRPPTETPDRIEAPRDEAAFGWSHDELSLLLERHVVPQDVLRWAQDLAPGPWQMRTAVCRDDEDEEEGGLLALARLSVAVLQEPEGEFYELRVPVPRTRGWGAKQRNELARERALVACIRTMGSGCERLLSAARELRGVLPVVFVFTKDWEECLAPLQRMLVRETLSAHLVPTGTYRP